MVRNKVKKLLATALVVGVTMSIGGNLVQASVMPSEGKVIELVSQSLKDGEYEVNNITNYVDENNATGQSMARRAVKDKSKVIVKDGVVSVTTYFNKALFPMMKDFKVSLNGTDLNAKVDEVAMSITYEIPSLDSNVLMEMFIVVMGREVGFNLTNDLDTLKLIKEYETNQKLENGNYTINNDVKYTGTGNAETGNTSARKTLKDVSDITVNDGKYTLSLNFNESSFKFIGDINIKVDGKEVSPIIDREKAKVSFEIASLTSKIDVSVFVTMMNRFTDFETILLKDTINGPIKPNPEPQPQPKPEPPKPQMEDKESVEDEVVIIKGKLYTIKNKVNHSNPTGQAMARQYLSEVSSLEEVDGKYYLTLTFTGMNYMSNHKFTIDGKEVPSRATKIDDNTTKYRFQIPSLDSTIKVSTYVDPMGRNVEFDVTLLKDTKTFVKEVTIEKLPQTGGALSSGILLGMGTAMLGAAGLLKRNKK